MPEDAAARQRDVDDERHRREEADRRAKRKVRDERRKGLSPVSSRFCDLIYNFSGTLIEFVNDLISLSS